MSVLPGEAHAQLEFGAERPRIFSIQRRPYRLGHEFQLGLGVLPLDAFYIGMVASASYTYHFSDFWAWEIAGGGYSLNFGTGLRRELFDVYGVEPVGGGGERIKAFATTSAVAKPLFGKLSIFNLDITYAETFFVAGVGPILKGDYWRPVINLGVGLRFWSGAALSWRLDVRDYLIFSGWIPENTLFLMVSASFNYYNADEHEEDTEWPD
jgi:outer membrane beta-barrel protein